MQDKIKEIDKLNVIDNRGISISSGRAYIQMIILSISVPAVFAFFLWLFIKKI